MKLNYSNHEIKKQEQQDTSKNHHGRKITPHEQDQPSCQSYLPRRLQAMASYGQSTCIFQMYGQLFKNGEICIIDSSTLLETQEATISSSTSCTATAEERRAPLRQLKGWSLQCVIKHTSPVSRWAHLGMPPSQKT